MGESFVFLYAAQRRINWHVQT